MLIEITVGHYTLGNSIYLSYYLWLLTSYQSLEMELRGISLYGFESLSKTASMISFLISGYFFIASKGAGTHPEIVTTQSLSNIRALIHKLQSLLFLHHVIFVNLSQSIS